MTTSFSKTIPVSTDQPFPRNTNSKPRHLLDSKLRRLSADVLPTAPYILRLNPDSKLPHSSPQEAFFWRKGTHFAHDERELQYLTFHRFHEGMLKSHGNWDDGKGSIAPPDEPVSQSSSGRTPGSGHVTKKLTHAEWKERRQRAQNNVAGGEAIATTSTVNGKEPRQDAPQQGPQENPPNDSAKAQPKQPEQRSSQKRSADEMNESNDTTSLNQTSASPSAKKARTSIDSDIIDTTMASPQKTMEESQIPQPSAQQPQALAPNVPAAVDNAKVESYHTKIPADPEKSKLSVVSPLSTQKEPAPSKNTPATAEAINLARVSLPPMLSPTLPANLEAELAKLTPILRGDGKNNKAVSVSPLVRPLHKISDKVAGTSKDPNNRPSQTGKMTEFVDRGTNVDVSKDSQKHPNPATRAKSNIIAPSKTAKQPFVAKEEAFALHDASKGTNTKHAITVNHVNTSTRYSQSSKGFPEAIPPKASEKKKLIVTLKIKSKIRRKQLSAYLRLKPTPAKRKMATPNANLDYESDEPPPKRSRGPADVTQKTQIPHQPFPSTSAPHRTEKTPMEHPATPSANLASTPILRATSNEGLKATPKRKNSTLHSSSKSNRRSYEQYLEDCEAYHRKVSGEERKTDYSRECQRFQALAIEIKHTNDKVFKKEDVSAEERELSVVTAIECVLCFMLAFTCVEEPARWESRPGDAGSWNSILPYLTQWKENAKKDFSVLYAVILQLEAVVRDMVHHAASWRFENTLRRQEAAEADDHLFEQCRRHIKESFDNQKKAEAAWIGGYRDLPMNVLESNFPKTWRNQRIEYARGKAHDPVCLRKYAERGFSLPLGKLSGPLEAVNFGMRLLGEYCEKKGVKWEPKFVY